MLEGASRVSGVTEKHQDASALSLSDEAEGLRRLLLAVVEDVRVVLVKLAECLQQMRQLRYLPEDTARNIALVSRDIYAPLANRLGVWQIKWELEDLTFRSLEPVAYKNLARLLDQRRVDRERFIRDVIGRVQEEMRRHGIAAAVSGRPKHIYSIWRKMQRKRLGFHELFDIRAVRILVDDVPACYAALGAVHALWPPIPGEFDDYIAKPKGNLYRSLHTAVVGPEEQTVEVQIRSHEMHEHAELGVAAHWRYKDGTRHDPSMDQRVASLRQLLDSREAPAASGDFLEQFRDDSDGERVYVLSPRGKVLELPRGATPLDFAYAIHTDVGHRCRGAKVDGHIVPLAYKLNNGETVEVLLKREPEPRRDWLSAQLGYLKSAKARGKVRHWFNQRDHDKNLAAGRAALERELNRLGVGNCDHEAMAKRCRYQRFEDFLTAIGRGEISAVQLARSLEDQVLPRPKPALETVRRPTSRLARSDDAIRIDGVGNLLVHMAGCCKPVPYDPITGFITRGHGVKVHRRDCQSLLQLSDEDRERLVDVQWTQGEGTFYAVDVQVRAFDRQGLLRDITAVLSQERVNVIAASTRTDPKDHTADVSLTLEISEVDQLARVLKKMSQLPNVLEARRLG
jgi:GTP pyrophosphokinase